MMTFRKKILPALLCAVLLLSFLPGRADAASCSVSISGATVEVGNSFSVKVSIGEKVAGVDITVSYDADVLTFNSGSGGVGNLSVSGGSGKIRIFDYYSSGDGSFSCSLSFKAKAAGKTTLKISHTDISDADGDSMSVKAGSSTVTVNEPKTASSDASLKSLSISPGKLSPAFSPDTTSYKTKVENSVKKVAISAKANDGAAKVSVSGNEGLTVGDNKVTVKVTAEDGSSRTYTITVTRAAAEKESEKETQKETEKESEKETQKETQKESEKESASETEKESEKGEYKLVTADGEKLTFRPSQGASLPKSFAMKTLKDGENEYTAFVLADDVQPLVYGRVGDKPAAYYFWDAETKTLTPYLTLTAGNKTLHPLATSSSYQMPDGFEKTSATVGGEKIAAMKPAGDTSGARFLLETVNADGARAAYQYDPADETLQRYAAPEVPEDTASAEELAAVKEERDALLGEKKELEERIESVSASVSEKDDQIAALSEEKGALVSEAESLTASARNYRIYAFVLVGLTAALAIALTAILLIRPGKDRKN